MASTYINISSTASNQAAYVRQAIDNLQRTVNLFEDLKAIFDQLAFGGDWLALSGKLGVTEAEAQAIYNLWGSVTTELQSTFITQLLSRTGNG